MTKITRNGTLFLGLVVAHITCLIVIAFLTRPSDLNVGIIRAGAFIGSTLIFYTILMSLFLRQITKNFGTAFINIHHFFAISGIGIMIFHGLTYVAYYFSNDMLMFFSQLLALWILTSIVAIVLIFIGIFGVLVRKRLKSLWRNLHALNYAAFALITFHAMLINTDIQTPIILGIYLGMLLVILLAFILKRQQLAKLQRRATNKEETL